MIQEHRGRLPLFHIDSTGWIASRSTPGPARISVSEGGGGRMVRRLRGPRSLNASRSQLRLPTRKRRIEYAASGERYASLIEKLKRRFK